MPGDFGGKFRRGTATDMRASSVLRPVSIVLASVVIAFAPDLGIPVHNINATMTI